MNVMGHYRPAIPFIIIAAALTLPAALAGCAGLPPARDIPHIRDEAAFMPEAFAWERTGAGVWSFRWRTANVQGAAVKIDLGRPGLRISAYPAAADIADGVFDAVEPAAFAARTGSAVVINATPYEAPAGPLSRRRALVGVHRVDGADLSPPVSRYAALCFAADNTATVAASQADIPAAAVYAFGGFFQILRGGEILPFRAVSHEARTAAGVSADGKTLYLLGTGNGSGMSFEECALVLLRLGAADALQFDGGSSSCMILDGKAVIGVRARTANLIGFF